MKLILPILLAAIGIGGGIGAGMLLRPAPTEEAQHAECAPTSDSKDMKAVEPEKEEDTSKEYVKLSNQFVIPVISSQRVDAMVVMSLSLEVDTGQRETVFAIEPKIRDAFLQVLFDHANNGGFAGAFTNSSTMDSLRRALLEASKNAAGDLVSDVLITEMARQDS